MTPDRKYATGLALRTALEERLKRVAREEGVDLQRLRRQVDLVDMVLLIQSGTLVPGRVVHALNATFGRRATHSIPAALTPPPEEWRSPFIRLAAECSLELSVSEAFSIVLEFCANL